MTKTKHRTPDENLKQWKKKKNLWERVKHNWRGCGCAMAVIFSCCGPIASVGILNELTDSDGSREIQLNPEFGGSFDPDSSDIAITPITE